jgi:hypothetical protein
MRGAARAERCASGLCSSTPTAADITSPYTEGGAQLGCTLIFLHNKALQIND